MAKSSINIGSVENDGTGDTLRAGAQKINDNFNEIYTAGPVGSNVQIAGNIITTIGENNDLVLKPGGIGRIQVRATVAPSIAGVYDLGTANAPFGDIRAQYIYGNGIGITGITNLTNGNSSIAVSPSGSITVTVRGNVTAVYSNTAATFNTDIVSTGNITAENFVGNIVGNISISGANTGVVFNDGGVAAADDNFTYDKTTETVTATRYAGDGSSLTGVLTDRGPATNNWNTLTQMGVYSVNTSSWSGTIGTPVDSQVSFGLLEVKNSTGNALQQTFYPGQYYMNNAKGRTMDQLDKNAK